MDQAIVVLPQQGRPDMATRRKNPPWAGAVLLRGLAGTAARLLSARVHTSGAASS